MTHTLKTHILEVMQDCVSGGTWLMWMDRDTGEQTLVAEMINQRPVDHDEKYPSELKRLAEVLGFDPMKGNVVLEESRADPEYDIVKAKWRKWRNLNPDPITTTDHIKLLVRRK